MKRFLLLLSSMLAFAALTVPAQAMPTPGTGGPAELLRYVGDPSSATGNAVSNGRCDVNGDGVDDVVVGAWFWDKAPNNNIGAAYVLLGGGDVHGASLSDPEETGAVRIDGPAVANATVAFSVGCVGDVNGDGYDDIAIGYYGKQRTYVVFGAKKFTALALDSLGDRGFIVKGNEASGNVGYSLAAVGDINDDGLDDFAVAEVVADTRGRTNNGRVWIVAGRDDISDVDLTAPTAGQVLATVDGAVSEERLGQIARVGDVNGDGIDDFALGSYTSTPWGGSVVVPGAAYVVFGGNTGEIDLADLGSKGFSIYGPQRQRDRLGVSVSAAGDVNRDGLADIIVGADGVDNATTGPRNGGAAVVLGSAATTTVYTDPVATHGQSVFTCPADETAGSCASPERRGYWINGVANSDSTGYSVAGLGDINGDGVPDFALGAYGFDPVNPDNPAAKMSGAGAVYVVFGRTSGAVQELSALDDTSGYRIDGLKAGDRLGRQVGLAGDFDDNGVRDLVAAGDFASRTAATGAQNGEVIVALMGRLRTAVTLSGPSRVPSGEEAVFTAAVTKTAGDRTPLAEGVVTFTRSGQPIEGCEAVAVSAGSASCSVTYESESTGDIVASYDGQPRLRSTDSSPLAFAVAKTPTTTGISASRTDPKPGQLVQLRADVTDGAANPATSGTVRFLSDGEPIPGCKQVALSTGDAICTTSWTSKGEPEVTAEYSGTDVLAGSASGAQTLSVGITSVIKPDTTPTVKYGTKPAALTGEIRTGDDLPTGTVEVREGTKVLGRATLAYGEYRIQLGATTLRPGSHTLTLAYGGDDRTRASERNIAVTVRKAASKVTFTRSRGTLKGTQRLTVHISVRAPGVTPSGKVQIRVGSKIVKTVALKSGKARYTLPKFTSKGTKKVTVTYLGSTTVAAGTSSTAKVVQK